MATIPTYAFGPMAFGWGTDGTSRQVSETVLVERIGKAGFKPRYYTPAVHRAAFALPGYVQALLPEER
ncbi:MAG: hypothetical protein AAF416_21975 [Pseudomonadota bacterium]